MTVRYGFRAIMKVGSPVLHCGLALWQAARACSRDDRRRRADRHLAGVHRRAIAMSVAARAVPATVRSTVMGIVSAAGSLGALLSAPIGQPPE